MDGRCLEMTMQPLCVPQAITLVGMSGVGKSYCAAQLAQQGFKIIDCDLMLAQLLQQQEGINGNSLQDMAAWLGFPHMPSYAQKQQQFLQYEQQVFKQAIQQVQLFLQYGHNCVVDTGGSMVYIATDLWQQLKALSQVVYIQMDESNIQKNLDLYIQNPRPTIWQNNFIQLQGQSVEQAYQSSYFKLVQHRHDLYLKLASLTVNQNNCLELINHTLNIRTSFYVC